MVLFQFVRKAKLSSLLSVVVILLFALMTPLGILLGKSLEGHPSQLYLNAVSAGIFLHVSTIILFESEKGHRFNSKKITAIISAIVLAHFL